MTLCVCVCVACKHTVYFKMCLRKRGGCRERERDKERRERERKREGGRGGEENLERLPETFPNKHTQTLRDRLEMLHIRNLTRASLRIHYHPLTCFHTITRIHYAITSSIIPKTITTHRSHTGCRCGNATETAGINYYAKQSGREPDT